MKTVKLHGELAERYGAYHTLAVASAAEAVRALCANYPGFDRHLYEATDRDVGFHVLVDEHLIDEKELVYPAGSLIQFIPVVRGAGSSAAKVILGASLIVAGAALNIFTGGTAAAIGVTLIKVGAALTISGVVQALTPVPKAPEPPEAADNKPSYTFNGAVNTSAQGQPVPIGYGRLIIGSAVVSAGISVDDLSPPPPDPLKTGGGTLYI